MSERGRNRKGSPLVLDPLHSHSIRHAAVGVFGKGCTPLCRNHHFNYSCANSRFFPLREFAPRALIRVARTLLRACNICRAIVCHYFACGYGNTMPTGLTFTVHAFFRPSQKTYQDIRSNVRVNDSGKARRFKISLPEEFRARRSRIVNL